MESTLCGARLELPLPPPLSSFSLSFSFTSSSPAECLCAGRDGERGSRPVRGSQGTGEGRGACQRRGMRGEGDGLGGHVAAIGIHNYAPLSAVLTYVIGSNFHRTLLMNPLPCARCGESPPFLSVPSPSAVPFRHVLLPSSLSMSPPPTILAPPRPA